MPQKKSTDWTRIKNDYVMGKLDASTGERSYPTLNELELKYNVSANTIAYHSSKENWTIQREEYAKEIQEQLQKRAKKFEAESLEKIIKENLQITRLAKTQWLKNKKKLLDEEKPFDVYDRDMIQFMKLEMEISKLIHGTDDVSRMQDNQEDNPVKGMGLTDLIALYRLNKQKNG